MSRRMRTGLFSVALLAAVGLALETVAGPTLFPGTNTRFSATGRQLAGRWELLLRTDAGRLKNAVLRVKIADENGGLIPADDLEFVLGVNHPLGASSDEDNWVRVHERAGVNPKGGLIDWTQSAMLHAKSTRKAAGRLALTDWEVYPEKGPKDSAIQASWRFWWLVLKWIMLPLTVFLTTDQGRILFKPRPQVTEEDIDALIQKVDGTDKHETKLMRRMLRNWAIKGDPNPIGSIRWSVRYSRWSQKHQVWHRARQQFVSRLRKSDPLRNYRNLLR